MRGSGARVEGFDALVRRLDRAVAPARVRL